MESITSSTPTSSSPTTTSLAARAAAAASATILAVGPAFCPTLRRSTAAAAPFSCESSGRRRCRRAAATRGKGNPERTTPAANHREGGIGTAAPGRQRAVGSSRGGIGQDHAHVQTRQGRCAAMLGRCQVRIEQGQMWKPQRSCCKPTHTHRHNPLFFYNHLMPSSEAMAELRISQILREQLHTSLDTAVDQLQRLYAGMQAVREEKRKSGHAHTRGRGD